MRKRADLGPTKPIKLADLIESGKQRREQVEAERKVKRKRKLKFPKGAKLRAVRGADYSKGVKR